jgi:hypothetical protein
LRISKKLSIALAPGQRRICRATGTFIAFADRRCGVLEIL